MNKNLFLLVALCATLSSSLVLSSDDAGNGGGSPRAGAPGSDRDQKVQSSVFWRVFTTVEGNPARLSTHFPVVRDACGSVGTPVIDVLAVAAVSVGALYGAKAASQNSTVRNGAVSLGAGLKGLGKECLAHPKVVATSAAAGGLAATAYHRNVTVSRCEASSKNPVTPTAFSADGKD